MYYSLNSAVRYYGGKSRICRKIIDLFPPHDIYYESHCGAFWVGLNKPKVLREIASDRDPELIQMWKIIQSRGNELIEFLESFTFSEETFDEAKYLLFSQDVIEVVSGYIIRNKMSYGGLGNHYQYKNHTDKFPQSEWDKYTDFYLPLIIERIKDVEFHCIDSINLIDVINQENALIYADPPYYLERDSYKFMMSREQHIAMLDLLNQNKSHIFISGYHDPLYDSKLSNWFCHEIEHYVEASKKTGDLNRVECLWHNKPNLISQFQY
jgi:DNA adenine methylase